MTSSQRAWRISSLRSELPLLVNGGFVDAEQVIERHSGADFTLQAGRHFITFRASDELDAAAVTLTINGAEEFHFRGSVQLYATASSLALQQSTAIAWPQPSEPRLGPPQLGSWVETALGSEVVMPAGDRRPSAAAFARRVRLVGLLFCSSQNELSKQFVRRLEQCYLRGLQFDVGIVVATVEPSAEDAAAARASFNSEWAVLPYRQVSPACKRYELVGVPRLVILHALSGESVRTNAVLDVMTHWDGPATILKLCGLPDPTCWVREQVRRKASSSRLKHRVELKPEDLLQAFRAADLDGSGSVSLGELMGAFRALGLTATQSTLGLFRAHDADHSDGLDFVEFCVLCAKCRDLLQPRDPERRQLLSIFAANDKTNVGFVSMGALLAGLASAGVASSAAEVCAIAGRSLGEGSEFDFPEFVQIAQRLRGIAMAA
jgi:Ca2+-binding EF-hand superfamily protein